MKYAMELLQCRAMRFTWWYVLCLVYRGFLRHQLKAAGPVCFHILAERGLWREYLGKMDCFVRIKPVKFDLKNFIAICEISVKIFRGCFFNSPGTSAHFDSLSGLIKKKVVGVWVLELTVLALNQ